MRDRASVNTVAVHTLNIVFPHILDIGCFSHTLDQCWRAVEHTCPRQVHYGVDSTIFTKSKNKTSMENFY